ncbi:MAG: porin [Betaproteobacteria bacterium]|nr:porin [Betaproteobacteria bacterium]
MQKKLIALAIAGLASSAAFAQTNVTIYGLMDFGYVNTSGNSGGVSSSDSTHRLDSGVAQGNRLGFKGAEDLGNGLKAIFEAEYGFSGDESTGLSTIRHAYVGVTGGFGTAVGGRLDGVRYGIFNKYDAFGGGNVGNFTQMTAQVDRANSAIAYISPSWSGFSFVGAYATNIGSQTNGLGLDPQETNGNKLDGMLTTLMGNYTNGPIDVTVDWERVHFDDYMLLGTIPLDRDTVTTIAGSYDFGVVKLRALWDKQKLEGRDGVGTVADWRSWFVSATAPVGNFLLKATYGRTKEKQTSDSTARKFGLGVDYNLSKRTKLYADYGNISQGDNSAIEISYKANTNAGTGLGGTKAFDFGIQHKF